MDSQQPQSPDIFEQILNKPEFINQCKQAGIEDETQIEEFWRQYSSAFQTSLLFAIFETLPEEQQTQLKDGLDLTTVDGLQSLLTRIDTGLLEKTIVVDIQPIFMQVAEKWKEQTEQLVKELKEKYG